MDHMYDGGSRVHPFMTSTRKSRSLMPHSVHMPPTRWYTSLLKQP